MARRLENVIFNSLQDPIAVMVERKWKYHGTCHGCRRYKLIRQIAYFTRATKGVEGEKRFAEFHALTCAEQWLKDIGNK